MTKFCSQEFSTFDTPDFNVADAIKVSSSMPGLMSPYEYNGSYLVDGDLQKASPMWKLSEHLQNSQSRILEFRLEGDYNKDEKNPLSFINTIYSCVTDVASDFVTYIYGRNDRYDIISINTGDIFFADFNLNRDARRKLINMGYVQTMNYFRNILPKKKEKLVDIYSNILKYLKKAEKALKSKNVEDVQWWFGYVFMELCENKEYTDRAIYNRIKYLKDEIYNNKSTILFFHTTFKNAKVLEEEMENLIFMIEERLSDIQLYLQIITK